jgi:hypothetical protein
MRPVEEFGEKRLELAYLLLQLAHLSPDPVSLFL